METEARVGKGEERDVVGRTVKARRLGEPGEGNPNNKMGEFGEHVS